MVTGGDRHRSMLEACERADRTPLNFADDHAQLRLHSGGNSLRHRLITACSNLGTLVITNGGNTATIDAGSGHGGVVAVYFVVNRQ